MNGTVHDDFPRWMSPMLVKELRQGLRSRLFAAAFLITQVLMLIAVLFGFLLNTSDTPGDLAPAIGAWFWLMIFIPLLLIMPFRAFGALNEEIRGNTLELIFLTRQTSWKILFGKWLALVFQSLLIVSAVLPYVVMRYFLGSVNIVAELQVLLFVFLFSLVMTAALISLSPIQSTLVRWVIILATLGGILVLPLAVVAAISLTAVMGRPAAGTVLLGWEAYLAAFVFVPILILSALEMGAARIAPIAENHALPKRLLAIGMLLTAWLLAAVGVPAEIAMILALIGALPTAAEGLCEPPQQARIIYQPLLRLGLPGRLLGHLLWPGWQYAIYFTLLLAALGAGIAFLTGVLHSIEAWTGFCSLIALVLLPAAVGRAIRPQSRNFLGWYLGLQLAQFLLTFMFMILVSGNSPLLPEEFVALTPPGALLLWVFQALDSSDAVTALPIQLLWIGVSVTILIAAARPVYRAVAALNANPSR